jgi:hypothetical protein
MTKPNYEMLSNAILMRVTKKEKKLANKLSEDYGNNMARMFRQLIMDANNKKYVNMPMQIAEKEKEVLRELKELLEAVKNSR